MKTETEQIYRERMLEVLLHIQSHLDEPLSLDALAEIACFSPFHFHRIFKGLVGESVKEHVRRLRLERAAQRLQVGEDSILAIALDAGYESHESFTRAFQKMFGGAPSVFRRKHRAARRSGAVSRVHYEPGGSLANFKPIARGGVEMEVKMEKVKPRRVAFARHIGPYNQCEAAWGKLCAWAGRKGLLGPGAVMLGISHDDPEVTPPEKLRYDACVTIGNDVKPEGEIGVQVIPGGEYAVVTHLGPYERLIQTYQKIFGEWAPASGRVVKAAPCYEVYRNDPHRTPPDQLLTDIYVPLEE